VILDTNVFISGIFFRGAPGHILSAWRDGRLDLLFSPAIFHEYREVGRRLGLKFPGVDVSPFLALLLTNGHLFQPDNLPEQVCTDPDDDRFLACAIESRCRTIISGDRHLVNASGYRGIRVWRPRLFVDHFLSNG